MITRLPFRRHLLAVALGQVLLAPLPAQAVGLGELTLESSLFQPLDATIEVYGIDSYETENLRVRIADQAAFLRAQIDRHSILNSIRLEVLSGDDGIVRIRLSSNRALREPLLPLLIDTEWPGGRLLREYTLMLDPPLTETPQASASSAPTRPAAATTSAPAPTPTPASVSVATLDVRAPVASESSRPAVYGPIRRNEMLGNIARDLRPLDTITLNQMMLALVQANPEAFILGNVNGLKAGSSLSVPDAAQVQQVSRAEANSQIALHHAAWASRQTLADYAAGAPSPAAATAPVAAPQSDPTATAQGRPAADQASSGLRLEPTLPPAPTPVSPLATAAGVSEKARQLELELADTRASLAEREEKLDELQTRMTVYGAELERLRQQLENYQMEQAAAASAAQVVTPAEPPPAAADSGSFFPWLVGGLLGGLGLSGLGWFWLGRRRADSERALDVGDVLADDGFTDMVENLAASTAMREARAAMVTPSVDLELPDTDEMEQVAGDRHGEDEILSEVDVFIAYGLLDRAREVLEEAIAEHPENEVYRARLQQMDAQPEQEPEQPGHEMDGIIVQSDNGEDARQIWARFAEMGLKLPPESAIIDLGGEDANKTVVWTAEDDAPEGSTHNIGQIGDDIEEIDFDVPPEQRSDAQTRKSKPTAQEQSLLGDTRSFDVPNAGAGEPTQAFDAAMDARDEAVGQPPVDNDEPTIEVPFDLDADALEALMAEADDEIVIDADKVEMDESSSPMVADGEMTGEWSWPGAEDYEGSVDRRRPTEEFSADTGGRDAASTQATPRARDAGADYYSDATQVMRSGTVEERSAADFIVDWQLDQDSTDSGTFDLPSDDDLAGLEDDETQQWVVPTELRDAVDANPARKKTRKDEDS